MIKFTVRVFKYNIVEHGNAVEALERLNNLLYYTVEGRDESGLLRTYCIFPETREQFNMIIEMLNFVGVYYEVK